MNLSRLRADDENVSDNAKNAQKPKNTTKGGKKQNLDFVELNLDLGSIASRNEMSQASSQEVGNALNRSMPP